MPPLVSVCMGTYNRERYVREALDSVFAQTYPNLEVIVVDDASTDGTLDILRSYGDRICLIERTSNTGLCQITRNQAIRATHGRFIAFLDSDDSWYPLKLERQMEFLDQHPEVPLCHTYVHVMDECSQVLGMRHEGRIRPTGMCFRELLDRCWITISSVMIRRELLDCVGHFNEDPFFRIGEDYEFFLRVARRFPLGFIPEVLGCYRKSGSGITANNWLYTPRVVPIHERVLRTPDLWRGSVTWSEVRQVLVDACMENAQFWRDHGHPRRSLFFAARVLRESPFHGVAWAHLGKSLCRSIFRRPPAA